MDGELHGLYEPDEELPTARISVWMRTAQKKQVVAFRSFLRTLVHEFLHHLDYEHFKLPETFHTEGFYRRESSLANALFGPGTPPSTPPRKPPQGRPPGAVSGVDRRPHCGKMRDLPRGALQQPSPVRSGSRDAARLGVHDPSQLRSLIRDSLAG